MRWRGSASFDEGMSDDPLGSRSISVVPVAAAAVAFRLQPVPGHRATALLQESSL